MVYKITCVCLIWKKTILGLFWKPLLKGFKIVLLFQRNGEFNSQFCEPEREREPNLICPKFENLTKAKAEKYYYGLPHLNIIMDCHTQILVWGATLKY